MANLRDFMEGRVKDPRGLLTECDQELLPALVKIYELSKPYTKESGYANPAMYAAMTAKDIRECVPEDMTLTYPNVCQVYESSGATDESAQELETFLFCLRDLFKILDDCKCCITKVDTRVAVQSACSNAVVNLACFIAAFYGVNESSNIPVKSECKVALAEYLEELGISKDVYHGELLDAVAAVNATDRMYVYEPLSPRYTEARKYLEDIIDNFRANASPLAEETFDRFLAGKLTVSDMLTLSDTGSTYDIEEKPVSRGTFLKTLSF